MDRPVIPEKLRPPPLPAVFLRRPRVCRLWRERARRRLLVTAGAGYGKSSFLAEVIEEDRRPALWYRVDEGDADLPDFSAHLLRLLGAPAGRPPRTAAAPADPRGILAAAVAALRDRGPAVLIFDDAHLLAGDALSVLEGLASYLPDDSTLVISSREPLLLGSTRARTAGQAGAVEARDLAFDLDEIAALFALRFPGSSLGTAHARRILDATEGWAAGLEMFLQTIAAPVPSAIDHALDRFGAAGSGWFDYLAEEVLLRLDESTREFLVRSSILPQCEPAICDRVLSRTDSRRVLDGLVRRNLFTLRESAGGATYRYHRLFHQFLRSRLAESGSDRDLRLLRRRAARELLHSGDPAGALELSAEIDDTAGVVSILARHGTRMLLAGRRDPVERALTRVPRPARARSAELLFLEARLQDDAGQWDQAERTYRKVLRLRPAAGRSVEVLSRIGQIMCRRGENGRAMAICRQGLRERQHADAETQGRLLWTLGVTACELGDLEEGDRRLEEARRVFHRCGDALGEAQVDYLLAANVHLARGDFAAGRETARRALVYLQGSGDLRRTCVCLGVFGWLSSLAGEIDEARYAADEARRTAQALAFPQPESMALHVLGRCALLEGDLARARGYLEEARRLGDALLDADGRIIPRLLLAECALRTGDPGLASKLAAEAMKLAREGRKRLHEAQAQLLLGWIEMDRAPQPNAARLRAGAAHWARAERALRRLGAHHDLHRLLLLRLSTEPLAPAIRRRLTAELLAATAGGGHDGLFLRAEPSRAARVLAAALADGIEEGRAAALLSGLGAQAVPELLKLAEAPREEARLRAVSLLAAAGGVPAREGLRRFARGEPSDASARKARLELAQVPQKALRICALGEFRVSVGETEVPGERWRSGRARRLFQFLLTRRFRWVEGEELLEALWPEADPEKSRASLWQSVFQLRRILEPSLRKSEVSCYVRVEETRYRLEPGVGHHYDAAEFEQAVHDADRLMGAGRSRAAEAKYRRALELYRGEFLAESPYEEFLTPVREHLRELFVHAAQRLIAIGSAARRWNDVVPLCRAILRDDPYLEEAYGHLVTALLHLGHRREALEAYQQFEARVVGELGLLRGARMQELAERIRVGRG